MTKNLINNHKPHSTIRILGANLRGAVWELVDYIIQQYEDVEFLGWTEDYVDLLIRVAEDVDIVILAQEEPDRMPGICSHLFNEYPHLKIVVMEPHSGKGTLYWLGLKQEKLEITPDNLHENLRKAYLLDISAES